MIIRRRTLLLSGAAGLGAALVGCTAAPEPVPAPAAAAETLPALAGIETRFGGRLGVHAVDTGTGRAVGHRSRRRCACWPSATRSRRRNGTAWPGRAPIVVTAFTAPRDPESTAGKPTIAAATRAVLTALG